MTYLAGLGHGESDESALAVGRLEVGNMSVLDQRIQALLHQVGSSPKRTYLGVASGTTREHLQCLHSGGRAHALGGCRLIIFVVVEALVLLNSIYKMGETNHISARAARYRMVYKKR